MKHRLKNWLKHMNYLPCPRCGSRETDTKGEDYIEHQICEYEEVCANCGKSVNYWAYGNYQHPQTYTELWNMRYSHWLYRLKRIFKKDELPF